MIELADGSISVTTGFVRANVLVHIPDLFLVVCETIDFFLLEGLIHDLIVGEEALAELRVFSKCQQALIPDPYDSKFLG